MENKQVNKLFKKYSFLKKKTLPDGIQCGAGWDSLVVGLFDALAASNPSSDFAITKVYSKMDTLRLHTKGGSNTTRFIIEEYAERSEETCEACGNDKSLEKCDKCKSGPVLPETDIDAILHPVDAAIANANATAAPCNGGCAGSCAGGCNGGTPPATP